MSQDVEVKLRDGMKHKGKLTAANEAQISIIATKEKKSKNNKNQPSDVNPEMTFQMKDILETRLVIKLS